MLELDGYTYCRIALKKNGSIISVTYAWVKKEKNKGESQSTRMEEIKVRQEVF